MKGKTISNDFYKLTKSERSDLEWYQQISGWYHAVRRFFDGDGAGLRVDHTSRVPLGPLVARQGKFALETAQVNV